MACLDAMRAYVCLNVKKSMLVKAFSCIRKVFLHGYNVHCSYFRMTLQPTMDLDEVEMERLLWSIEPLPLTNMKLLPPHLKWVLEMAFFIVGTPAESLQYSIVATILPTRKASLKVLQTDNFYSDLAIAAWKRTFYLYKNGSHIPILMLEYIV